VAVFVYLGGFCRFSLNDINMSIAEVEYIILYLEIALVIFD
jgi:hypothetical protein